MPAHVQTRTRPWLAVLAALAFGNLAFGFAQTSIVPAIPSIQADFGASRAVSAYLLSGYLIVASVTIPVFGKLGDRYGRRRMSLIALVVYFAGAVGAAVAPTIETVIVFRSLQGVGGAVLSLSFAIARDEVPERRLGIAIGGLLGAFGLGFVLGFGSSGVVVDTLDWRPLFGFGSVAVLIAFVLIRKLVPPSAVTTDARPDLPGAALFSACLALPVLALTEAQLSGWGSPLVIVPFVLTPVFFLLWALRERTTADPLLDPKLLASRPVALTYAAVGLAGVTGFAVVFLVPFLVQAPLDLPPGLRDEAGFGVAGGPVRAGLFLVPFALGLLVASPPAGYLTDLVGAKRPFASGLALTTVGAAALAIWTTVAPLLLAGAFVVGIGQGLALGAASTTITASVRQEETGIAASFVSVLLLAGGGLGSQIASILIGTAVVADTSVPAPGAFTLGFGVAAALGVVATGLALLLPAERAADGAPDQPLTT